MGKHIIGDKVEYIKDIQSLVYYLHAKLWLITSFVKMIWMDPLFIVLVPYILMSSYAT